MDTSILQDIGLSDGEIKVYLALIELGPSTSGPIIDQANLQSSVVHRVLKSLIEKGIVTFVLIGKDRQYQASDPNDLLNFLEEKKKKLQDILPALSAKQAKSQDRNEAEMFLGPKAVMIMLDNLIKDAKPKEEYLSLSLGEHHNDPIIVRFYRHYQLRRTEKHLDTKVLANISVKPIFEKQYDRKQLKYAKIRYTNLSFPQGIVIFRDMVCFINWEKKPMAVKVTNSFMANQFRKFFLGAYNSCKNTY